MERTTREERETVIMQTIFAITAISFIVLFLCSPFAYYAHAQTVAPKPHTPVLTKTPILEIHIADNGLVLLRGVRVTSVTPDTLSVTSAWDWTYFTWKIQTKLFTQFLASSGDKITSGDIHAGDVITITGMLVAGGTGPAVDATFVRKQ